jgi:hypothetical protein
MAFLKSLLVVLFLPMSLVAQRFTHPVMASPDDASPVARPLTLLPDTIRVLALRVQFQADDDTRTTGNGAFLLEAGGDSSLDAPPHDATYFRDHLTFLRNYFRKVSRGKVVLETELLDSTITLQHSMSAYSPPKGGPLTAVADLARDSWRAADSLGLVGDFSLYQCFIIFHAGAGRDIDLVGTLGYDPTPLDIPSLYFGLNGFRAAYGSAYQGIPVQGGSFFLTNSLVLPETERRSLPALGGESTLLLGINGLLCSSFGNFLGLPDLFDTNTGRSGIGRFGLMDGQAIFSFSGLFPPEPSAWEKYWLGWAEPLVLGAGTSSLILPAVGFSSVDSTRADTIYRIPIGGSEYLLVENRNRDPERNGQHITFSLRGEQRRLSLQYDTAGFNALDVSLALGVVTDVEDFDWSLPGSLESDGTFYDGGVLIWHIDDAVIDATIELNGVNADPSRRGVDLEEADGSQDIGQQYDQFTAGSGSEEGTPLDFWYQGNPAPVYGNEFSPTSMPDTRTNTGANSHVTLKGFSARSPRMSATAVLGDARIAPVPGFPRNLGEKFSGGPGCSITASDLDGDGVAEILVSTSGDSVVRPGLPPSAGPSVLSLVRLTNSNGGGTLDGGIVRANNLFTRFSAAPLVFPSQAGGVPRIFLTESPREGASGTPSRIEGYLFRDVNGDSLADLFFSAPLTRSIDLPPLGIAPDSLVAFGAGGGRIYLAGVGGMGLDSVDLPGAGEPALCLWEGTGEVAVSSGSSVTILQIGSANPILATRDFGETILHAPVAASFRIGGQEKPLLAFCTTRGVYLVDGSLNPLPGFPREGTLFSQMALADLDGDGVRDLVVFSGQEVWAVNVAGSLLDNFPVHLPSPLASSPLVADVDGDGKPEIVGVTTDGLVVALTSGGKMAPGFPLQAGTGTQSAAVVDAGVPGALGIPIGLVVASAEDGVVSAWITGSALSPSPARPWPQYQRDALHSGSDFSALAGAPLSSDFFPAGRAYNWPNPVYEGKTFLRYYIRENAEVRIKIFDLAGDLVADFPGPGIGGMDNEVAWDVQGVQSGIYFAHIEASGAGASGKVVVKIAVVQ